MKNLLIILAITLVSLSALDAFAKTCIVTVKRNTYGALKVEPGEKDSNAIVFACDGQRKTFQRTHLDLDEETSHVITAIETSENVKLKLCTGSPDYNNYYGITCIFQSNDQLEKEDKK